MTKTQVQIPDELYREAKRVAREREMSFAEVVRRGLEYITRVYPPLPKRKKGQKWEMPKAVKLGLKKDPFADPDWRAKLWSDAALDADELPRKE
jgi:predicted CopG family antitoxin